MPEIHITLTPEEIEKIPDEKIIVVLIDTLRASTTIITALANGAKDIKPFANRKELEDYDQKNIGSHFLLAGEEKGRPVEDFNLSNSPLDYQKKIIQGQTILLETSNGTRVLTRLNPDNQILIGALVNSLAIVQDIQETEQDIYLVCAGTRGNFSLEDFYTAGRFSYLLLKMGWAGHDLVTAAARIYEDNREYDEIINLFLQSCNGQNLSKLGYIDDIKFASKVDVFDIVPYWDGNRILL